MFRISIPIPCHEDWNKMSSNEQGRHCTVCAKTVIDFTNMNDEQVKNYLIDKKDEHPCGRFKRDQLHRIRIVLPHNILQIQMPWWKRFLVASLIVFSTTLFSCEINTNDPVQNSDGAVKEGIEKPPLPSILNDGAIVGGMGIMWDSVEMTVPGTIVLPDFPAIPVIPDTSEWEGLKGVLLYSPDSTIELEPVILPEDPVEIRLDSSDMDCELPPV